MTDFLDYVMLIHCTAIGFGGTKLYITHTLFCSLGVGWLWIEDRRVTVAVDMPLQSVFNIIFYWGKVLQIHLVCQFFSNYYCYCNLWISRFWHEKHGYCLMCNSAPLKLLKGSMLVCRDCLHTTCCKLALWMVGSRVFCDTLCVKLHLWFW